MINSWYICSLPRPQPDFSPTPITTEEQVNEWLRFFDMSAPLVCCSIFISHDPVSVERGGASGRGYARFPLPLQSLDLRVEHTHCFSHHGDGGHYHYDTTPQEVEYLGYYVPTEGVHRVDRPKQTHTIGRD